MIDWTNVAPAIRDVFTTLASGDVTSPASFAADWWGRKQGMRHPSGAELTLRITRIDNDGIRDERRAVDVDDGEGGIIRNVKLFGTRAIAIEAKVERHNNTDQLWAWSMTERLRTGLQRPDIEETLAEAGVVFVDTETATPMSVQIGGREISAAVIVALFRVGLYDPTGVPTNWIERVRLSTEIRNASGDLVGSNVTDLEIPA